MITQGKWEVHEGDLRQNGRGEFIEIWCNNGVLLTINEGEDCFAGVSDEDRANARLIAAAPDLLAACEELLNTYLDSTTDGSGCKCLRCKRASKKAEAAIAAAHDRPQTM